MQPHTIILLLLGTLPIIIAQQLWGRGLYHNGPYNFAGCTAEQGSRLIDVFKKTGYYLDNAVISEARKGSTASRTFKTFFSTNKQDDVTNVFTKMTTGATVRGSDGQDMIPSFVCANEGIPELQQAHNACLDQPRIGFTLGGSFLIFLCPRFFTGSHYIDFPEPRLCPILPSGGGNTYQTNNMEGRVYINQNRMALAIHELAHKYTVEKAPETYLINECIMRAPDVQLGNADNYAFFASSMYMNPDSHA